MSESSSHTIAFTESVGIEEALQRLRAEVDRVLASYTQAERQVVRVEVPAPGLDPIAWLEAQPAMPRLYWSARGESDVMAGAGIADQISGCRALSMLNDRLRAIGEGQRTRYYGGMRFAGGARKEGRWIAFDQARFVLPRLEVRASGADVRLACNLVLPTDRAHRDEILRQIETTLPTGDLASGTMPSLVLREDWLETEAWKDAVRRTLAEIAEGSVEKVVLARRASFQFDADIPVFRLLQLLKEATPGCFHFCVQPEDGPAFIGASPERLFRRKGRHIESEAVAGTRPRGDSRRDDARLRSELLHSEKDRREHAYVQQFIQEKLGPLCNVLGVDHGSGEITLTRGRHLYSSVQGTLHDAVTDVDLIRALHPTPAVGGYPSGAALEAIARLEEMDRGWYAGPIGWVGKEGAEFAVGIRSGLVSGPMLDLFSGAGIVAGSDPEAEWKEIEHKIGDFISVLGIERRNGL